LVEEMLGPWRGGQGPIGRQLGKGLMFLRITYDKVQNIYKN